MKSLVGSISNHLIARLTLTALQEQMERLATTAASGGERKDAVDHCLAGIDRLSHEVKDASSYIPAYDQRTYADVRMTPRPN